MAALPPPEPPVYPPAGPRWPPHPPTRWPPPAPPPPPPPRNRGWVVAVPLGVLALLAAIVAVVRGGGDATVAPLTTPAPTTTALAPSSTAPPDDAGLEVAVATVSPVRTINPHRADIGADAQRTAIAIAEQVFPSAFTHHPDGSWVLDESWLEGAEVTTSSPFTIVYRLVPGAAWSDGTPIGCDDFALAWNAISGRVPSFSTALADRPIDRNPDTVTYAAIESITCEGSEVTVQLSRPVAEWRMLFAHLLPAHAIASVAGVDDLADALATGDLTRLAPVARVWDDSFGPNLDDRLLVSGGPFAVDEVLPSGEARLHRNDAYWGVPPTLSGLIFRPFPEPSGLLGALRRGAVQVAEFGPDEDLFRSMDEVPGYEVAVEPAHGYVELGFLSPYDFGAEQPELAEAAVRRAITGCVDRDAIATDLLSVFLSEPLTADSHLLAPGEPGYRPAHDAVAGRDVAGSRAELEAAGWVGGADGVYTKAGQRLSLVLAHSSSAREARIAGGIAAACAEAGIEVVTVVDETDLQRSALRLQAWGPYTSVEAQLSRFEEDGLLNNSAYANAAITPAFDAVRGSGGNAEALAQAAVSADAMLWEDGASVPLYPLIMVTTWDERLCGVEPNPTTLGFTWNARSWQPCPSPSGGGTGVP